jgi:O-antigen ligase
MPTFSLDSIKKVYFNNKLKFLEIALLSLFLAFLPSLEAPKNIFLACYLLVALYRQSQLPLSNWNVWDWIFLCLILSPFLTALSPGFAGGAEWKGFRGMLLWTIFGWTISRSDYNFIEKKYLFIFSIIMTLPPLIWGLVELLFLHTSKSLELHSVGHVNHSAIYLCIIFGASVSILLSQSQKLKKNNIFFYMSLIAIFLIYGLLKSESRGVFGIALVLAFAIIFLSKASMKMKVILSFIIITFTIHFTIVKPLPVVTKQLVSMNSHDVYGIGERTKVWNAAFEVARLNPLLGIGNGNWNYIELDQIKLAVQSRGEVFNPENYALQYAHPHNIYLANLVDRGIFGLIIFLIFMFVWLITLINSYKKFNQDPKSLLLIMGSFSAWMSIFGIGFVNTTFHHENTLLALFFLGLHLSFLRQKNQLKLLK